MRFARLFPALEWVRGYRRQDLGPDLQAGLTTAILLVPQAMAYAMLAGLPPEVGLYSAIVPPALYALLGTSKQLAVGPVAMDSLLVAVTVGGLAAAGSADYLALAVLLALLVGVLQVVMGFMRLGFLTNFLSAPVISGFTSAAALVIGLNQLKHIMGLDLARSSNIFVILSDAVEQITQFDLPTLALGLGSIAVLLLLKRFAPKIPRALVVVTVGSLLVGGLGLEVAIVGHVPAGLPAPSVPELRPEMWSELVPAAFTIALVGFMESISVSEALARRKGDRIDASQELIALGAANLGGAFFGAYPVTGGFSRTAVNEQAGARTHLSGLTTAALVLLALMFLTPWFHDLPKAALAGIIMTAVFGLIDLKAPLRLWRVHRIDFGVLVTTFVATLALGIQAGIATGVAVALGVFVIRSTRPHYAVLGRLPGTDAFRNLKNHPTAEPIPGVAALRFDAQFYFGNTSFLETTLETVEKATKGPLRAVILDCSSVNRLDSSADAALWRITDGLEKRGVLFRMANVKRPVLEVMERSGLAERLGPDAYHLTVADAVRDLDAVSASNPP